MNVPSIVNEWLKQNGYDGLYTDDCGCRVDDIAPCGGEPMFECRAGVQCGDIIVPKNYQFTKDVF